jgi:hypothetical protein
VKEAVENHPLRAAVVNRQPSASRIFLRIRWKALLGLC